MKNRTLIIIIAGLLVIFVVLLVYNLFLKPKRPTSDSSFEEFFGSPEDLLYEIESGPFQEKLAGVLLGRPIAAFGANEDEMAVLLTDGALVGIDSAGNKREAGRIPGPVARARMSEIGDVAFEDSSGQWFLYKAASGETESLSPQTTGADISPAGQIAVAEEDERGSRVIVRGSNNSSPVSGREGSQRPSATNGASRTVFAGNIPDLEARWVNERTLALSTTPSGMAPGILYLLDTSSRRLSRLLGGRYGLTAIISPNGEWAVFSETGSTGKQTILKSLNVSTKQERVLGLNALPEKCVFSPLSKSIVYCATFSTDPRAQIMPDDYRKDVFQNRKSDLVRFNLELNGASVIYKDLPVDPILLQLSSDERDLLFINKRDGNLYRLSLE